VNVSQAQPAYIPEAIQRRCVYCLSNDKLHSRQILLRGKHFYLCAPRGQMIEGYLVIAPLSCTGSLSALSGCWFPELRLMKNVVTAFYREVYGVMDGTLYEQGRAGGGARIDEADRFPHHAHLCCLPLAVDLHTLLGRQYVRKNVSGPENLPLVVPDCPYVYIEGPDSEGLLKRCVYVPATDEERLELERIRLKPVIATLIGLPDRGSWRTYPGDRELESLIRRFGLFKGNSQYTESVMANILDEIKSLKGLAQNQSAQGQYETAAKTLRDGIDVLEAALTGRESHRDSSHRAFAPADAEENCIAAELADLYGILGGVRRKQGDLMQSIVAYDQGFRYESNPRYGIVNTYNALNRLVSRILMYPDSLSDPDVLRNVHELEFVNIPRALNELQTELKKEVDGVRSNDCWAAGDLVFTCALNGDDQGALDALQYFVSCSPPANAYSAYIYWVGALAQLDTSRKEALNKVKALFEDRMKTASGDV